jgi:hypothetical protein
MKLLSKIFKIILAFLLLPFCAGAVLVLYQVILKTGSAQKIWEAVFAGVLAWILIYAILPKPERIYVLGHELTHAIWSLGFGGKLKKMKVGADGGHVLITKSNFLTTLAPYFFPFYVVLTVIIFLIGNYFFNWTNYILWFYFLIGAMYAFHITLTYSTVKIHQPDIAEEGYIFSAVVIFLGNMIVLLIGIPLLTGKINIFFVIDLWIKHSSEIYRQIYFFSSHSLS